MTAIEKMPGDPLASLERMAQAVAKSGLFGLKTPEQALALMLVAQAEGRHPATAAQDYHVIQGRPSLKADALLARDDSPGQKELHQAWAALQAVPFPDVANSPTVMFSLLRAGARILPHTGMFNTRLVCHLPLIVPEGCRFRVGNEVRTWEPGKLMVFDDTIEHEAWNDSDRDRVVLIFDVWRPDLTAQEREELAALFAGKLG